jgi:chromosome segregation protein
VRFSRLRLTGFKSFVEPTDFRIEPGLTGVVGPNGCGKSNLLEALRWVMGAASAKAMRGEGMDDVIFSGTGARPARNHAEVMLTVDNADRTAPARYNAEPVLEVTRRIDRGEGSTFRINGTEVRARDVQLLFADASTGANSPALVRQGQISELIAAKPQNRRRILEEAAGISGLHGRRHEAELRVRAADVNLARIDDLAGELETNLQRSRREARAATKYKKLSSDIRALQSALLHARWAESAAAVEAAAKEAAAAAASAEAAARAAAIATTASLRAEAAIPPYRDEETAAAAGLHRLAIEKDRLDRALESASADVERLVGDIARIDADAAREAQAALDAERAIARLAADIQTLEREIAEAPERLPHLQAASEAAEAARSRAEATVEALATQVAAGEAEARGAQARLAEADARLARTARALSQAVSERGALGPEADPRLAAATADLGAVNQALTRARDELEAAEAAREQATQSEAKARQAARAAEDRLAGLTVEAQALARLSAQASAEAYAPALEQVFPQAGLEAALAAALGDDLAAPLDSRAPAFWGGRAASGPVWPGGVTPLAPLIGAPPQLAARLAFTGLVARADGARLQGALPPGARLVSREGDLWRWDGFTVKRDAPSSAQVRLQQRSRLAVIEAEIETLEPASASAKADHQAAADALAAANEAARLARLAPAAAEQDVARARETVERLEREGARRDAQAASLDDTIARFELEREEASAAAAQARTDAAAVSEDQALVAHLDRARQEALALREPASAARTALDLEVHGREARTRRLESLRRDVADWQTRAEAANRRRTSLAKERQKAAGALEAARDAPGLIEERRRGLMEDLGAAEARKTASGDALAIAEAGRAEADRAARAADAHAADTREARAGAVARHEGAVARMNDHAGAVIEATGMAPEELGLQLEGDAVAKLSDVDRTESRLTSLERERDLIGPVNLLAEDESTELADRLAGMAAERADLAGALGRLRQAIAELNAEGRERLTAAFEIIDGHFRALFTTLFEGGAAELRLVESEDPLEAGLEILACPPGKRMAVMSLMSGGEQALTAVALIFAVFLANPAPICFLDEVDAPLDDANVERFCDLLDEMRRRAPTRFVTITHNPLTMSRMDRLFGVTMAERGVSQLVSVDLRAAEELAAR